MDEPKTTGKVRFKEELEILNKSNSQDNMLLSPSGSRPFLPLSRTPAPKRMLSSASPSAVKVPTESEVREKLDFDLDELVGDDPDILKMNQQLEMMSAALQQKEHEAKASQEAR